MYRWCPRHDSNLRHQDYIQGTLTPLFHTHESRTQEGGTIESKTPNNLISADACTIVDLLKRGEITPHELLDALEEHIAAVNPSVNALPTLCFDRAHTHAERLMKKQIEHGNILIVIPFILKNGLNMQKDCLL